MSRRRRHDGKGKLIDMSHVAARDHAEIERYRDRESVDAQVRGLALAKGWKVSEQRDR